MSKPKPHPPKKPVALRPAAGNSRLNAQTRRLLTKHYRAKHGVR
jgi:hypothetical protein